MNISSAIAFNRLLNTVNLHNSTAGSRRKISSMQSLFRSVKHILECLVTRVGCLTFLDGNILGLDTQFFRTVIFFFCDLVFIISANWNLSIFRLCYTQSYFTSLPILTIVQFLLLYNLFVNFFIFFAGRIKMKFLFQMISPNAHLWHIDFYFSCCQTKQLSNHTNSMP